MLNKVLRLAYLFRRIQSYYFFEEKRKALREEIDSLSKNELESSDDSLKIILKAKHTINLVNFADPYRVDKGEVDVNIRYDRRFTAYFFRDRNDTRPVYKKGRQIEVHLPFSCSEELFDVKPTTSYMGTFPEAEIIDKDLVFTIEFLSDVDTPEQVEKRINDKIKIIKDYANWLNNDINGFNGSIDSIIDTHIKERRKKISRDEEFLGKLAVQKQTLPEIGFVKPERKLDLKILKEDLAKKIEPTLEIETYDEIIKIVNSLGINLERSSRRLRELDEESLRDTFVMALNSVYKGMASAEAFNKEGDTDILIKYQDKNIYIAECKIWRGDKYFNEGITQLLSYLTWRDSKTSYIIFSKNQDVRTVIKKARQFLEESPYFISKSKEISESCVIYKFKHNNESTDECLLTLHVFDLGKS
jgi:hypothetical protein